MFGRGLQTRLLVNAVQGTPPYVTPSYTPHSCTVSTYDHPRNYHSSRQLVITVQVSPYHTSSQTLYITPSQTLIPTLKLPLITYSQLTYPIPLISLILSHMGCHVQGCCSVCCSSLTHNLPYQPYLIPLIPHSLTIPITPGMLFSVLFKYFQSTSAGK